MDKQKEVSFESELKELEKIVENLEQGNIPLAKLIERYEEGMRHLKVCREKLAAAELRIKQLRDVDSDGNAISQDFAKE